MTNDTLAPLTFDDLESTLSHIFKVHHLWINDDITLFKLGETLDKLGYKIVYRPDDNKKTS